MNPQINLATARHAARNAGVPEERLLELDRRAAAIVLDYGGAITKADMLKLETAELDYLASAILAVRDKSSEQGNAASVDRPVILVSVGLIFTVLSPFAIWATSPVTVMLSIYAGALCCAVGILGFVYGPYSSKPG